MDIDHVDKAIVENYRKLRNRMGVITLAFPVVVIAMGAFWGIGLKATLSDYYYAGEPQGSRVDLFPVRLWFCGILLPSASSCSGIAVFPRTRIAGSALPASSLSASRYSRRHPRTEPIGSCSNTWGYRGFRCMAFAPCWRSRASRS